MGENFTPNLTDGDRWWASHPARSGLSQLLFEQLRFRCLEPIVLVGLGAINTQVSAINGPLTPGLLQELAV